MTTIYAGIVDVAPDGTQTISRRTMTIATGYDYSFGGNESARILCAKGNGQFAVYDLDVGSQVKTGLQPEVVNAYSSLEVATDSTGDGWLILDYYSDSTTWDEHYSIRRFTWGGYWYSPITTDGPRCTVPLVADGTHTHRYRTINPDQVYDYGTYTFLCSTNYDNDTHQTSYDVIVWDNASTTPLVVRIYDWAAFYPYSYSPMRVTQTSQGFFVFYERPVVVPTGTAIVDNVWRSWVRRSLDPVTGDLGPEVFITDVAGSSWYTTICQRADGGVAALVVESDYLVPVPWNWYAERKIVLMDADSSLQTGDAVAYNWNGADPLIDPNNFYELYFSAGVYIGSSSGGTTASSNTFAPPTLGNVELVSEASLSLTSSAPNRWVTTLEALSAPAAIQPYYVVHGLPRAHTAFGIDASSVVDVGALEPGSGWPDPASVDLGSTYRYLPRPLVSGGAWQDTTNSQPLWGWTLEYYDPDGSYIRGQDLVSTGVVGVVDASTNGFIDWTTDVSAGYTVAMVVVLRQPSNDYSVLIGTYNDDWYVHPDQGYLQLRYAANGQIQLEQNTRLSTFQSATGIARPGQPIVVLLSMDQANQVALTGLLDRNAAVRYDRLPMALPNTPDVCIGADLTEYMEAQHTSNMDILDVAIWHRPLGYDEAMQVLHTYDSIYGVTTS